VLQLAPSAWGYVKRGYWCSARSWKSCVGATLGLCSPHPWEALIATFPLSLSRRVSQRCHATPATLAHPAISANPTHAG